MTDNTRVLDNDVRKDLNQSLNQSLYQDMDSIDHLRRVKDKDKRKSKWRQIEKLKEENLLRKEILEFNAYS
jgi:hypothetical protein